MSNGEREADKKRGTHREEATVTESGEGVFEVTSVFLLPAKEHSIVNRFWQFTSSGFREEEQHTGGGDASHPEHNLG